MWLSTASPLLSASLDLTYGANGQLQRVAESGDSRFLTFTYDGAGRLWQVTDHGGRTVEFGYDANGNLTTVQDVRGGTWTYEYADPAHPHFMTARRNPLNGDHHQLYLRRRGARDAGD